MAKARVKQHVCTACYYVQLAPPGITYCRVCGGRLMPTLPSKSVTMRMPPEIFQAAGKLRLRTSESFSVFVCRLIREELERLKEKT